MIQVRKAEERGHFNHGWLDTYHTFSFADYLDPHHMGFRALRVINDDRVQPGQGFGMHGHRDMEIITYILEGALEHKDSLGNGSVIRTGELQRMSAGTGIRHSEFNPSKTQPVHLYQIWIEPNRRGVTPGYEQRLIPAEEKSGRLRLVASPDGAEGSFTIHQDAKLYLSTLASGQSVSHRLKDGRAAWLQVLRGEVETFGGNFEAGDGVAIADEKEVTLKASGDSEVLLFDLA